MYDLLNLEFDSTKDFKMHMPTVAEIKTKCQSVHQGDPTVEIVRPFSRYLTWVAIRMGLGANQASSANIVVSISIGVLFSIGGDIACIAAVLLMFFGTVLDSTDGELARYWEKSSLTGLLLDRLNSVFLYPLMFFGMAVGSVGAGDAHWPLYFGFLASWAMMAMRMVKTSVDATVIDGLMADKARMEDGFQMSKSTEFQGAGNIIRARKNVVLWIIDLLLVRQIGTVAAIAAATTLEVFAPRLIVSIGNAPVGPILATVVIYSMLATLAVFVGIKTFVANRTAECNYFAVRAMITRSEAKGRTNEINQNTVGKDAPCSVE